MTRGKVTTINRSLQRMITSLFPERTIRLSGLLLTVCLSFVQGQATPAEQPSTTLSATTPIANGDFSANTDFAGWENQSPLVIRELRGETAVFETGLMQTLGTLVHDLYVSATSPVFDLEFKVGFSTDEQISVGMIFDAFSVSLKDIDGTTAAIFLTADAGGFVWAPATPGTLLISPGTIQRAAILSPAFIPLKARTEAFRVTVSVPRELRDRQLKLYLDLFDNQNGVESLVWVDDFALVPEPRVWVLGLAGAALLVAFRRIRR